MACKRKTRLQAGKGMMKKRGLRGKKKRGLRGMKKKRGLRGKKRRGLAGKRMMMR